MSKLKIIISALFILPVLVIAVAVSFILTLDPNRLKPFIIESAAKKGLAVTLEGDIAWRLYPNIGLDVAALEVANLKTAQPLASLKRARLDVALKPLLTRKIEVVGIAIDGAKLNYLVNAKGQSSWPTIETAAPKSASSHAATPQNAHDPQATSAEVLNIAEVFITDLSFNYQDAQGTRFKLENLNAEATGVNLTGKPFNVIVHSNVSYTGYPITRIESAGAIGLNLNAQRLALEAFNAALFIGERERHQTADLSSQVSATVNWGDALTAKSRLKLTAANARQLLAKLDIPLPATQNPQVFKALNVEAVLEYSPKQFTLEEVVLKLDKTTARARLAVQGLSEPLALSQATFDAAFKVDRVNIDEYLPPALDKSLPKAVDKTEKHSATALPFELLRAANARLNVVVDGLKVTDIDLADINLTLEAQKGLITVKPVRLKLAEGRLNAELTLDARAKTASKIQANSSSKPQATLEGAVNTQGIQLVNLLAQLKQEPLLAGDFVSNVTFTSYGHTDQDLTKNLEANITLNSQSLKLTNMNIEKSFCEAASLLTGNPPSEATWPAYSQLSPVSLSARYAQDKITLTALNADIQKLKVSSRGELNLASGDFKFPLDVSLADFANGVTGCNIVDTQWRTRIVPLRCKGNVINIGAKTCLPDGPRITQLLKNKAKTEVAERLDKAKNTAEDKAKKEADRFIQKHIDDDKVDALKQSVKGILKLK